MLTYVNMSSFKSKRPGPREGAGLTVHLASKLSGLCEFRYTVYVK